VPHSCFIHCGNRVRFSIIFSFIDCLPYEGLLSGGSTRFHIRYRPKSHSFNNECIKMI
jgi:hypothetical protein